MVELLGGCACGAIRYRVTGEPICVSHCHCHDCRRATGAPFITWVTLESSYFTLTDGAPAVYGSTPDVQRGFCGTCGTTLTYGNVLHPEEVDLSAATLDDPGAVTPQDHLWTKSRLPWIHLSDGLPELNASHWEHGYPPRPQSNE